MLYSDSLTVAETDALADRIIGLRDQTASPDDRETLLLAANVLRKAGPALVMIDAVMRHVREALPQAQRESIESVAQASLNTRADGG